MSDFLQYWHDWREQAVREAIPVISVANALFLQTILQQHHPKHILEIGSAIGVSGAWLAHTVAPWHGHVTTLEISLPNHALAQHHFDSLGLHNIDAYCANAITWLEQEAPLRLKLGLAGFDCVFIDAHKLQSQHFYTACLPYLANHGVILIDDAWKFRHKMQGLYQHLAQTKQAYTLYFVDNNDATLLINY